MRKTVDSFRYALEGIWQCLRTQRNFRIHISAAVGVALIAPYFALSRVEIAILVFAVFLVMVTEMFNTSIEFLVDLKTRDRHKFAKYAKDVAAGAVAFAALCAIGVGVALFGKIDVLMNMFFDIVASWVKLAIAGLYVALAMFFIFKGGKNV